MTDHENYELPRYTLRRCARCEGGALTMKLDRIELDRIELGERASYWLTMEQLIRDVVPEEDLEVSVTAYLIAVMELAGKPQWHEH